MAGKLCVPLPDLCGGQEHTYPSIVSSATGLLPLAIQESLCLQSYLAAGRLLKQRNSLPFALAAPSWWRPHRLNWRILCPENGREEEKGFLAESGDGVGGERVSELDVLIKPEASSSPFV